MRVKRYLAFSLLAALILSLFSACRRNQAQVDLADAIEHKDDTSVYEKIGTGVTIDMVREDENGLATVEYEGTVYELGMDFLSMAMVYNTQVPENSAYATSEEVFNQWWKLYIQRWNYMVPEIPLYSNQYYDLYNTKLQNFVTTPYWGPAEAVIGASVREGSTNSVILGNITALSGAFRNAAWGKATPGSADLDIENMTTGHSTVMTDKTGSYIWNMKALVEEPETVLGADGSLTYTIKIREDLKFSDGSAIKAENYIAALLANSTQVAAAAGGSGTAGLQLVGFTPFKAYTGSGEQVYFQGVKLLDDYTFSVTFTADYANYYYTMAHAAFSPVPLEMYLGQARIVTNQEGSCGLSGEFYAKTTKNNAQVYAMVDVINQNLAWNSGIAYSGPYTVADYNAASLTATLARNPYYSGDDARGIPSIDTVIYVRVVSETQLDQFTSGQVDVIAGITGAAETREALDIISRAPDKYAQTHYDRAGYGKLGFRCDFGPTAFTEVRQAIMYTINRPEFAQTFTGGYGSVVHGPYYEGYSAYMAVEDDILLNRYTFSVDSAIDVLEEGGWVYNERGETFEAGKDKVRYKKLEGYALSADNLQFTTTDGRYRTVKLSDGYYMPLAINYYGTQPNAVTDLLLTSWAQNPSVTEGIGMYVVYTSTDFNSGLYGELNRLEGYGYNGTPKLNAINFATGFTSTVYDYSFNWTVDREYYDDHQQAYLMDEADFWENYHQ